MENAAKGLLMAGGMILAIIVISIFIYGYTNITHLAESKQDEESLKEIEKFNEPYLAFNKTAMYGTDVISILNLAISNNKLNNVENRPNNELYVDVSFKLNKDSIRDTVYLYTYNTKTNKYDVKEVGTSKNSKYGAEDFEFKKGNTYSLSNNLEPIDAFVQSSDDQTEQKNITSTDNDENTVLEYTVTYKGIADFKRKTFKCSEVKYDSSGRVKSIKFEQIDESSYGGRS